MESTYFGVSENPKISRLYFQAKRSSKNIIVCSLGRNYLNDVGLSRSLAQAVCSSESLLGIYKKYILYIQLWDTNEKMGYLSEKAFVGL